MRALTSAQGVLLRWRRIVKVFSKLAALTSCSAISMGMLAPAMAQQENPPQQTNSAQNSTAEEASDDVVIIRGFREGLATAREIARNADNLVDVQSADDVGKLPDTNIAEAL